MQGRLLDNTRVGLSTRRSALAMAAGGAMAGCMGPQDTSADHADNGAAERYVTGGPVPDLPVREVTAPGSLARLDGVDLWYWDTGGDGVPVVLLHPATGSGLIWGYQQQQFAAADYRVIGYSRRGHNGSSPLEANDPGTGAGDLKMLGDHLGLDTMHLLASAAGGFIGASFALEWPERVLTLTIACSIVSIADPRMQALVPWLFESWWQETPHDLRELSMSYRAVNPAGHARWKELHAISRSGNTQPVTQPAGTVNATLETMGMIATPTLLISGGADLLAPPPVARALHDAMQDSELTILSEAGHSAYWERPEEFNAAVLDFLGRRGR